MLWVICATQIAVISQMKLQVNFLDKLKENNHNTPSVDYFKCFQFNYHDFKQRLSISWGRKGQVLPWIFND